VIFQEEEMKMAGCRKSWIRTANLKDVLAIAEKAFVLNT